MAVQEEPDNGFDEYEIVVIFSHPTNKHIVRASSMFYSKSAYEEAKKVLEVCCKGVIIPCSGKGSYEVVKYFCRGVKRSFLESGRP